MKESKVPRLMAPPTQDNRNSSNTKNTNMKSTTRTFNITLKDAITDNDVITATLLEPRQATQMLEFLVVKASSTYNAIMGRIGIHGFKAVPSSYHSVIKFPTRDGIGEERGDQKMAISSYVASLREDGVGGQVLPIEDLDI
ncbi:hypothetical protein AgCh_027812 [Apium graveolens]